MDEYEGHLTTLSLPALLAEPGALQTQAHHLTSSLTSLTHTSYPTFLSLHRTTAALTTSLSSLASSLSDLISTSLPALQDATAAWNTRTTDILRERSKARLVLDHHDKIKDLLDIPIFIDSCVRNGYFQEALALSSHVGVMAARPGAPPIIASVHAEVEGAIAQMLIVLLGTLNEPGRKLPALWKAVNFLRKMEAFAPGKDKSEHGISDEAPSLGIPKLSDRDKEDIARFLKKYIDVWREGAYDILTQYSTIFLEQHPHPHPTSPILASKSPTHQRRSSVQLTSPPQHPAPTPAPSLLPFLSPHLLSQLLPLLQSTLPLLPLPFISSILTQLTYCATAFTRVGLDFRGLVGTLVSSAVATSVRQSLQEIELLLPENSSNKSSGKVRSFCERKPSEWLVVSSVVDAPPAPAQVQTPPHIPPQMLASYPPLAKYTNAVLGVLNALRLLAPIGILYELVGMIDETLGRAGEELMGYLKGFVGKDKEESEVKVSRAVGEAYFQVLVPFVRRALVEGVYGVPISELGELGVDGEERLKKVLEEWEEVIST
ncbi:Conserved oligomeric Golgi complex subunit 8 [Termitomyces sp. J132]|nr:Conserved oligomeric Golgi complex subunit 8 [Termitomyces sp. J132]